jgi:hypothetical protein
MVVYMYLNMKRDIETDMNTKTNIDTDTDTDSYFLVFNHSSRRGRHVGSR